MHRKRLQRLVKHGLVLHPMVIGSNRHQEQAQITQFGVTHLVNLLSVVIGVVGPQYQGKGLPFPTWVLSQKSYFFYIRPETGFTSSQFNDLSNN